MGINLPGESGQKRWPSKIFGAEYPEKGWAAKLTGDTEIMFIQLKTLDMAKYLVETIILQKKVSSEIQLVDVLLLLLYLSI